MNQAELDTKLDALAAAIAECKARVEALPTQPVDLSPQGAKVDAAIAAIQGIPTPIR